MARVKLTAGRIRDFGRRPDQQQSFLWDTEAPRLAVRATQGAKVFVFQGRIHGETPRIKIGDCSAWNIDQARAEARRLQTLIDQGIDPRQDKADKIAAERKATEVAAAKAERQATEAERQTVLVSSAWNLYLVDRKPHWGERSQRDHEATARLEGTILPSGKLAKAGPLADLMPRRLGELSADILNEWLTKEAAARPASAALAFRHLRTFLRWCSEQKAYEGLVKPTDLLVKAVREQVPAGRAKSDCLQKEQLPLWFDGVRKIGNPVIGAYLQALLLTGARREELGKLTWAEVDFTWSMLTIGDKVEGERIIPLTPYVASLLVNLPRRNAWVFSSPGAAAGRLVEPRIAHERVLRETGLPHLTLHGLRRSFGTLSEWVECPAGISAQIMGHKPSAIAEKHYRARPVDLLRQWHTMIEAFILGEAGIDQPSIATLAPGLRRVK